MDNGLFTGQGHPYDSKLDTILEKLSSMEKAIKSIVELLAENALKK
jgi:hypothetical protein